METMRATGLVCQSSLVEFKRSSLPRKTLTPHPPTGSRVSLPFRNHGSLLLLRMAEHSKIPMAISQNAFLASQLVSVKNKITNPIVVIDNYDSFTYNLCQYMGELGCNFEVYRNDELTVDELKKKNPRGVLISPGPGTPQDSGISLQTVLELGPTVPLFGVCMGLQCIGEAFGGKIVRSPHGVMHKKKVPLSIIMRVGKTAYFLGYQTLVYHQECLNIFLIFLPQPLGRPMHMGTHSPWALPLAIAIYNHKFSLS
ncbi:unnamed protein product [Camellia sinensis]